MTRRIVMAAAMLLASFHAGAAPLITDVPALKKAFAALVQGRYTSTQCTDVPGKDGDLRRGGFSISPAGDIVAEGTSLSMFDPGASFVLNKFYSSRSGQPEHGFSYEISVGDRMFSISTNLDSSQGWVEAGATRGTRNVTEGMMCPEIDLSRAKVAPEAYDMTEFMVPVFETGGFVEGECMSVGQQKVRRPARFRVAADGVTINDTVFAFADRRNPVVMMVVGSRVSDGATGGSFDWKDGTSLHMTRQFGTGVFTSFSYMLPDRPEEKMFCRVRR